ncbi:MULTISPECIES: hypothetical protein [Pseudomonas]|uniref:hypothetical protein n=1 Tax=Pseudomonas TaxID=286 RepID=UPI0018E6DE41|nr:MULTISPECIES: hypothetical protein [Pseudomonas]MBJ2349624.1 hypothetical protein [Pseudomonas canavaninivorans]MBL3545045.1 hypothetical protein [Pseudomonas sp. HB05]
MAITDNNPLEYDELEIPDGGPAHPPAPADSVGINIAAARLVFPHDGLRLLLPPWDNMGRGDSFRIKLNNIPVLPGSIDEETEVGQWIERYIPVGGLVDGDFDLSYDVKILGEPGYTPSAVTKVHVKIEFAPPGGQDQDGDTPGHSELRLTIPPEFLPPGAVDQEAARLGVPVTIEPYPIMAEGDRIKMSWGGEIIWKTVGPEHFPPQNQPLVITVDEETILNGKDSDDSGLPVVFEVYDRVDNKSEDFSAEVRVIVDTGNSRLDAPLIEEVFNLELDVDQLGEADLTFQVIAVGSHFKVDDEVEMSLTGTTAEGEKIEEVIFAREKILSVPNVLMFKRPSAEVRQLAGGPHAAFFYRLIKADGSADLFSKIFSPRIVGRANPLAAPIPLDEIAGTLDPQLSSTTIEIPLDPAMEEGNAIELIWNGTKANGTSYKPDLPLHPITANEAEGRVPIEIVVAGEHLTAIEEGTLDLYYKLLRDAVSREVIEEESLHTDLLSIGEPRAELPLPVVEGESGGVLDPADKPDGTRLIVLKYSGQTAGDRVHMLWWGSNTGRYRDSIPVTGSTENQNIPFTIRAALIEDNRDGTVRAMYWVKRAGGGTSASEILNISIGVQAIPTLDNVKDANGVEIPEGTSAVTTSVSVNGTASKGRDVEIYDGSGASAVLKGTRTADPVTGVWSLADIAVADGGHRFYAKALYNTGGTPNSNVRLFTAIAAMTPTIASVKDPQNTEIPHNSTTTATTVTLSGKAVNSQRVEIFDGATSKGTAPVSANGDWSKEVTGLSLAAHSFTAKGLYGSNPVSEARTLTVWDLTTFDGRDWNNWQIDPTAEGEFNVRSENNNFYLDFVTPRSSVARYVLLKLISGLEVGATYEFSLDSVALQTFANKPEINLMSPQGLSAAGELTNVWKNIAGSFLATSREMRLGIVFWPFGDSPHTHSGFKLDNILIKQIQKNDAVESN